jgi:hypothetical protein
MREIMIKIAVALGFGSAMDGIFLAIRTMFKGGSLAEALPVQGGIVVLGFIYALCAPFKDKREDLGALWNVKMLALIGIFAGLLVLEVAAIDFYLKPSPDEMIAFGISSSGLAIGTFHLLKRSLRP